MKKSPYWWDDAGPPAPAGTGELAPEADAAVVGAGLTGLTAALTLAKSGKSVVVLDALNPGQGASSRNGGMIGGGHRIPQELIFTRYGNSLAKRLLSELHIESTEFSLRLMKVEGIDCDFQKSGRLHLFWRSSEYDPMMRRLELLRRTIPVEATPVPASELHREINSTAYRGAILYHLHGGLNPAKWVAGIREAAERSGALVYGNCLVRSIDQTRTGFQLDTALGTLRAGKVLVATNGYTTRGLGRVRHRVFPVPSFIVTTESLGESAVGKLMPGQRMYVESRLRHCYYRASPNRRRIVFGGRAALVKPPDSFFTGQLRKLMTGIFPQLRGVGISHSWWGRTGFTFATLPHVGQIDGIWHALGYCGNGNGMAPWLGHKAALKMIGDPAGETAFSKIEAPARWYYNGFPWFMPFADLRFRLEDMTSSIGR